MIVFVVLACLLVRLAESGSARETTQELLELRKGALGGLAGAAALLVAGIGVAIWQGVVVADDTTTRGVVTLLAREAGETTDRVGHLHDPRLQAIADRIRRGDIVDRNGQPIAGTTAGGAADLSAERRARHRARHPARHRPAPGLDARAPAREHAARLRRAAGRPRHVAGREPRRRRAPALRRALAGRAAGGPPQGGGHARARRVGAPAPAAGAGLPAAAAPPAHGRRSPRGRDQEGVGGREVAHGAHHARRAAAAGRVEHPEGGGQEEPGARGSGGAARRRHRAGAGARAVARLRSRRPEVHAPPHRPRVRPARQEVHGHVRAVAGQDRHPRHLPGRLHGQDLHQPRRRAGRDHQPAPRLPGEGAADLRLPLPRRAGPGLQRRAGTRPSTTSPRTPSTGTSTSPTPSA